LSKWVDERIAEMKSKNTMPKHLSEKYIRERLTERFSRAAWPVPPGGTVHWKIAGLPEFDGWLVIRFKFYRDRGEADYELPVRFVLQGRDDHEAKVERRYLVDKEHTFSVPASLIREDGTIDIAFSNLSINEIPVGTWFPADGGIQALCPAASMAENFVRAGLIILAKLSFIAILGVFASTFLSIPVGVFLTTVVYFAGHMRDYFMSEILENFYLFGSSMVPPGTRPNPGDEIVRNILHNVFRIFPDFGSDDVVTMLSEGFFIDGWSLASCFVWFVAIRGGILVVAAWLIFRRRELAALTPQS
jgi:hypothetical protein